MEAWRFIDSGFADGFTNMAVDTALARCHDGRPVLRVYGWKPPAISLGHHQRLNDLDLEKCGRDNLDVVFRPTGGRAVLHADEVTYAVILGPGSRLYDPCILPLYERISAGLTAALRQLGVALEFERNARALPLHEKSGLDRLCFASAIRYELGHDGKKAIGSAQRRFGPVALQHGSILLGDAHLQLVDYLSRREEGWQLQARRFMQEKTLCLNEIAPRPLEYSQVAAALRDGFATRWGISFSDSALSREEEAEALRWRQIFRDQTAMDAQHD
ncbi:MAG TPA: lipoate--protein ligase family protein [bacterium]|nr:lipoate--protein ligase family protein [bacterium]